MLIPHRNLLIAAAIWLALAILAALVPESLPLWQGTGALLLVVVAADAWLATHSGPPPTVERHTHHTWPVGVEQNIRLRLRSPDHACSGELFDRHPDAFPATNMPQAFAIAADGWCELAYRVMPGERGAHAFGMTELRLDSPFRLWRTTHKIGTGQTVRVYPNFARIAQYTMLATDNRLSQLGVLRRRRRGDGLDFRQLREYRREDSPRQIDWKATARMGKPISREYQDERDQQIVFLIDCGQRMRSRDGTLSHFDHTLNAMLLLAYVALRQGDAVGFATFAGEAPRFFAPRKAMNTMQMLMNAAYDLQPTVQTPDYLAASRTLIQHIGKRSLVVLLTNLRDEDEDTLRPALAQLRRRHLVMLASLRETGLDDVLREETDDFESALSYAAAVEYARERQRLLSQIRAQGAQVLDVTPARLPVALVNRYWDLKRSGII